MTLRSRIKNHSEECLDQAKEELKDILESGCGNSYAAGYERAIIDSMIRMLEICGENHDEE